jgi:glutaredoxin
MEPHPNTRSLNDASQSLGRSLACVRSIALRPPPVRKRALILSLLVPLLSTGLHACGGEGDDATAGQAESPEETLADGEVVPLPFAVDGASETLMLTYADSEGAHTVHSVNEVPEAARRNVRVDSLALAPEQRPEGGRVYVADLSAHRPGEALEARLVPRAAFDAYVDLAAQAGREPAGGGAAAGALGGDEVVLYGASWCGACRQARGFFEREGVAFRDVDIERDPGARQEMMRKAQAAGVSTNGIPVIDFRGTIIPGFDERRIRRLMRDAPAAPEPPDVQPI